MIMIVFMNESLLFNGVNHSLTLHNTPSLLTFRRFLKELEIVCVLAGNSKCCSELILLFSFLLESSRQSTRFPGIHYLNNCFKVSMCFQDGVKTSLENDERF